MAQVLKQEKYPGQGRLTGISLTPKTMEETDRLQGDLPRSRWIERALIMYNSSVKEKEESQNSVRVSESSNQVPSAPTPTTSTEVIVPETNTLNFEEVSGR